jgi:hypothetical protein
MIPECGELRTLFVALRGTAREIRCCRPNVQASQLRPISGRSQFEVSKFGNAENNKVPPIRKAMTQSEFTKIESSVNDSKLTKVGPRYGVNFALDTSTEWMIKIRRPRAPQIIHILEFAPSLAKTMKGPAQTHWSDWDVTAWD